VVGRGMLGAMTDSLVVRPMSPEEYSLVRSLAVDAFDGDEHIGELFDELRNSWCWSDELCFVAEEDGSIVGQVLYTQAIVDAPRELVSVLVLSPIGVHPDLQGRGIGSRLIRESLAVIRSRPEPLVFLEGSPTYYRRFGFEPGAGRGFLKPSERIPDEAFMVLAFDGHEPSITGRLVYSDAFWRTDSVGLREEGTEGPSSREPRDESWPVYEWRGEFANDEANQLHAEAFETRVFDQTEWNWRVLTERHSLGWVTARINGALVGFVNVVWDGGVHAWIQDVMVATRARRRGIGNGLVDRAREGAQRADCEWLHVDFDDELKPFYFDSCGFTPTNGGLIDLT